MPTKDVAKLYKKQKRELAMISTAKFETTNLVMFACIVLSSLLTGNALIFLK